MSDTVRLSNVLWPVEVLGPGRRLGIWFQGCGIGCEGCCSGDTWSPEGGRSWTAGELEVEVAAAVGAGVTGVTISGGEPFDQPDELGSLLASLRRHHPQLDVLVFSGYTAERLRTRWKELVALIDLVVAGPYVAGQARGEPWRGSANQVALTGDPQRAARLAAWATERRHPGIQITMTADDRLVVVGIPRPGELDRIQDALERQGISVANQEWQSGRSSPRPNPSRGHQ